MGSEAPSNVLPEPFIPQPEAGPQARAVIIHSKRVLGMVMR